MPHVAPQLRRSFYDWVEAGMPPAASVEVDYEEEPWPAERLLGAMVHSSDIMPSGICEQLDIARGSSCGCAAQRLLVEREQVSARRLATRCCRRTRRRSASLRPRTGSGSCARRCRPAARAACERD